jgi:hypothetical protein
MERLKRCKKLKFCNFVFDRTESTTGKWMGKTAHLNTVLTVFEAQGGQAPLSPEQSVAKDVA